MRKGEGAVHARRVKTIATLLNCAIALGCGGRSVGRSDDDSASSRGGATAGGATAGGTTSGAAGAVEPAVPTPCQTDYDCLRVEASSDAVPLCSGAGQCEIGTPGPQQARGCGQTYPVPSLELHDSRVFQSALCGTGLCLLRSYSIDPANTLCTSRCATDADCDAPFAFTTSCLPTEVHENGDTGIVVNVCMPPMPW